MLRLVCNKRGLGMVEVLIAMVLTSVAVLAVFTLVSPAWQASAKSDNLGRASGILYDQLLRQEARIMNPCCSLPTNTSNVLTYASGQTTAQSGDAEFRVTTTITGPTSGSWLVKVNVTWNDHDWKAFKSISESMAVTRQDTFASSLACTVGGTICY